MRAYTLTILLALSSWITVIPSARSQENPQEGVEVLARGPVHEAFAQPADSQPVEAPIVDKQPPDAIDEVPPDQKPEGDDIVWIPGYWAWDEENKDFVWVSGFWRDAPPNRVWVPGNWQRAGEGWQWVSGFWAVENQEQIEYVPTPPATIDRGPSTPAPDADSVYVPGCWVWQQARFYWRPGFWMAFRPGWVWVPAHYVWTPGGCLFVNGYWDVPLHRRGLLFAPVRFARYERVRFVPTYVVRNDFLMTALFVRPAWRSYYFGDYFDNRYVDRGFVPWVDYRPYRGATVFDVNFNYYRFRYPTRTWEQNLRTLYLARARNEVPRPPRTWNQQTQVVNNITQKNVGNTTVNQQINITNVQNVSVLAPVSRANNMEVTALASLAGAKADIREDGTRALKLNTISKDQQAVAQKAAAQVRETARQRQQAEAKLAASGPPKREAEQSRSIALPKAPARTVDPAAPKSKKAREAPPQPVAPKPQATVPKDPKEDDPPKSKKDDRPPIPVPLPKPKEKVDPGPMPKPKGKVDDPPPKTKKDDRPPIPVPLPKPKIEPDPSPPKVKEKKDNAPVVPQPMPKTPPAPKAKEKEKNKKDDD